MQCVFSKDSDWQRPISVHSGEPISNSMGGSISASVRYSLLTRTRRHNSQLIELSQAPSRRLCESGPALRRSTQYTARRWSYLRPLTVVRRQTAVFQPSYQIAVHVRTAAEQTSESVIVFSLDEVRARGMWRSTASTYADSWAISTTRFCQTNVFRSATVRTAAGVPSSSGSGPSYAARHSSTCYISAPSFSAPSIVVCSDSVFLPVCSNYIGAYITSKSALICILHKKNTFLWARAQRGIPSLALALAQIKQGRKPYNAVDARHVDFPKFGGRRRYGGRHWWCGVRQSYVSEYRYMLQFCLNLEFKYWVPQFWRKRAPMGVGLRGVRLGASNFLQIALHSP